MREKQSVVAHRTGEPTKHKKNYEQIGIFD